MSSKKPMLIVYAGPNGSGKSTVLSHLNHFGEYTNADDVVAATGMSNIEAAQFVDAKRNFLFIRTTYGAKTSCRL